MKARERDQGIEVQHEAMRRLLNAVNRPHRVYLTHATLGGRMAIRFCIGQAQTEAQNVVAAWRMIAKAAGGVGM